MLEVRSQAAPRMARRERLRQTDAPRLPALDALRGAIMVLMALDHASAFIARRHSSEFWSGAITQYDSAALFLIRFVTHLCAPGFLFLMGCAMSLFAEGRRARGWGEGRIARFYVTRGLLLVLINQVLENPAWILGLLSGKLPQSPPLPGAGGMPLLLTGVLTAIGLSAALSGPLLRFGAGVWLALGVVALAVSNLFVPPPSEAAVPFPLWMRLALLPGQTGFLVVLYPVLPWLAIAALGVAFGRVLSRDPGRWLGRTGWIGLGLLAAGTVLRTLGGFGNIVPPREASWIEFLNVVKYPPSLVFTAWMLGANLILLAILAKAPRWLMAGLGTYGQAALFFYLAHLWLYSILGAIFFKAGGGLAVMILVWLAGLVPLWFLCRAYREFKSARSPESFWRFF